MTLWVQEILDNEYFKGTGNVLKTILGGSMQKHPIGTPVALGATAAAGLGVLGNEDSGCVGRNTKNSYDAFC